MIYLSLNVNGLIKESWKEKNGSLYKFLSYTLAEIIRLQEVNLNQDKLSLQEQQQKGPYVDGKVDNAY